MITLYFTFEKFPVPVNLVNLDEIDSYFTFLLAVTQNHVLGKKALKIDF